MYHMTMNSMNRPAEIQRRIIERGVPIPILVKMLDSGYFGQPSTNEML